MKDARSLLLNCLEPSGKQPRFAEFPVFPGVEKVNKVMLIDVPILDPNALELPLPEFFVSKTQTAEVYDKIRSSPIYDIVKQGDEESEILALVTASGFDQYKRVHDRFQDILEVPLSKGDIKKKREDEDKEPETNRAIKPEQLILTLEELKAEDFPIPAVLDSTSSLENGWVDTLPGANNERTKMVALDCEMCKTANGYAVTRVALIDKERNVLINELVKPAEEITDYVTHISGVSELLLKDITTSLADIQKKIMQFLDGDTILVGHGLVNDMKVLKMRHPYIIDTSMIYQHKNGPPYKPSLRDLTTRYLKRTIQVRDEDKEPGQEQGHDPCEDAIASLDLLERKLRYGMNYGLHGLSITETLLDFLQRSKKTGAVVECNATLSSLLEQKMTANKQDYFSLETDGQVKDKSIEEHHKKDFVLVRFNLSQESEQEREEKFCDLFKQMLDEMEPNTAFCITTGYRSNKQRENMREKRIAFKKKLKSVGLAVIPDEERWSLEDDQLLEKVADETRRGFLFASIKN
ncbi:ribonuclease H-like protein [Backusella circina FSU 941]|nr:ribonuclease H-like protein [Backusella circina FSU 941]